MKVLILSNLYPPHVIGGYEALCQEAADYLRQQGHTVHVITSTYGVSGPTVDGDVFRFLKLESEMEHYDPRNTLNHWSDNGHNQQVLARLVDELQPDILFVWGMWNLSRSMLEMAERSVKPRVVYYLASPWPAEPTALAAYWDAPADRATRRPVKQALRSLARWTIPDAWQPRSLKFEHTICNSISLRDQLAAAGHAVGNAAIVCEGIDLNPYRTMTPSRRTPSDPLRLVFVGRLGWHKGPHTIVEAMAELVNHRRLNSVYLTICGAGQSEYKQHLHNLVQAGRLAEYVTFQKPIPRMTLPAFMGQFNALVLSSIWEEALARIMQEALAAGRVILGTTTGATKEFLVDGENALTFPPGDALRLADQIERLAGDPELGFRLASAGQQLAFERFDSRRMMLEIESFLQSVLDEGMEDSQVSRKAEHAASIPV